MAQLKNVPICALPISSVVLGQIFSLTTLTVLAFKVFDRSIFKISFYISQKFAPSSVPLSISLVSSKQTWDELILLLSTKASVPHNEWLTQQRKAIFIFPVSWFLCLLC